MPGFLLTVGAVTQCAHGGVAQPLGVIPRVKALGQPVVAQPTVYSIAGCSVKPPPAACATAQWLTAGTRVKAMGLPVLLQDSQSTCTPTGTPLTIIVNQSRVRGI
ncbi:hypothetical protein [Methyloterricola oryzae]|uniref:hypothetical protein n=1 Tax=Methyloterricola oryzae TaxID=1495050 RepID=UPI0005EAEF27|nr:hypothetical protein [Methyloterricola oryzae]